MTLQRNSLARASKNSMRRARRWDTRGLGKIIALWDARDSWGSYRPVFEAKNRAKLGRRDERRISGKED